MFKYLAVAGLAFVVVACTASTKNPENVNVGESQNGRNQAKDDAGAGSTPESASDSGVADTSKEPLPKSFKPITINFDDLQEGDGITDQYAKYVRFSSDPGCNGEATAAAGAASSPPFFLLTYHSCSTGHKASVFLDFSKPIERFRFMAVGVDYKSRVLTVRLIDSAGVVVSKDVLGSGWHTSVDLSAIATQIRRVEIVEIDDAGGLGFDDFRFDFPE